MPNFKNRPLPHMACSELPNTPNLTLALQTHRCQFSGMSWRLVFAVAVALVMAVPVAAQPRLKDHSASFTLENDLFFQTDKYYTNGVQLTVSERLDSRLDITKTVLEKVCGIAGCGADIDEFLFAQTRVGQLMYTPVKIRDPLPQPLDRPWAGLLYYAADYQFGSKDERVFTTISGQVGVIGPGALAEQTQTWIHKVTKNDLPKGWGNQIGGELGLLASIEKRHAIGGVTKTESNEKPVEIRTTGYWRIAAGNIMTFAGAGLKLAIGKDLPNVVPRESGGIGVKRMSDSRPMDLSPTSANSQCLFRWLRCSAFADAELRLVAWNVFLDGAMFHDGPRISKKPLVADLSLGFRLDFPESRNSVTGPWFVQFKATRRSPEFTSIDPVPSQTFGALTLGTEF
jgi:lipid A 3-O-deacylase